MTFSRTLLLLLTALVMVPAGVADAGRKPKPEHQIKFATLAPEGSTWMNTMHTIDEEVRAKTENRVGFKFYPGGVQGDEKDVLRKIRNGQLHAGGFTGFGLGAILPEVRVHELPYLFESYEELDYVREKTGDHFVKAFAEKGYIHLGWTDVGFVYVMSQEPIRSPEDMQAAKMWVWAGDPLATMFYDAFDVSPIPLSSPDVLTSLQTGIINGFYGPPLAVIALQWYTRVSYLSNAPVTLGMGGVMVSKKGLRGISAADIATLKEISGRHLRELALKTRIQNDEAMEELRKEGIKIVEFTDAERQVFIDRGRAAWGDGVGKLYSQEILDRIKAVLAEYRAR